MSILVGPELHPSLVIPDLGQRRRESALLDMLRRARDAGRVRDPELARATLLARERLGPTSPGRGVAFPNARSLLVDEACWVLARSRRGIEWGAPDDGAVHLVLMVLSPSETSVETHHELLARAAAALKPARTRSRLIEADGADDLLALAREVLG